MSRKYHSPIEFKFNEDQSEDIIRTVAYHRKDFPLAVIWFPQKTHDEIRNSIATPFQRTNEASGIGTLEKLPLEIIFNILLCLDIDSLFQVRKVNAKARWVVNSLSEYARMVSHGLNLFCALLRTKHATKVTLREFDEALCTKSCFACGEFAGFMSILAWKRCCFHCFQEATETQVRPLAWVKRNVQMKKGELDMLTKMKTLPGKYSMAERERKRRVEVVLLEQATYIHEDLTHYRELALEGNIYQQRDLIFNFMGSCALPYYDKQTGRVEHGVSCAGCQVHARRRFNGLMDQLSKYSARDEVYARDEFLDHFRWCKHAQMLWRSSKEGQARPPRLPQFARNGGKFRSRE